MSEVQLVYKEALSDTQTDYLGVHGIIAIAQSLVKGLDDQK